MHPFSWLHQLARKWFPANRRQRRARRERPRFVRLGVELLEDRLAPATTTWTGQSIVWGNPGNWSNGVPTSTVDAVIPVTGMMGTLSSTSSAGSLTIDSEATLDLSSYTLTDAGYLSNSGTLNGDTGTLNVGGNSTNAGTFTATAKWNTPDERCKPSLP